MRILSYSHSESSGTGITTISLTESLTFCGKLIKMILWNKHSTSKLRMAMKGVQGMDFSNITMRSYSTRLENGLLPLIRFVCCWMIIPPSQIFEHVSDYYTFSRYKIDGWLHCIVKRVLFVVANNLWTDDGHVSLYQPLFIDTIDKFLHLWSL